MKLTALARVTNRQWRVDPVSGFLRCTVTVLRECVMDYTLDEMGGGPPTGTVREGVVGVFTPLHSLQDPVALQSLEGMPAVVGHVWQDTQTNPIACGNIAGAPTCDGPVLVADVLVTDADTIRRIQLPPNDPDHLCEISSAFDADVIWQQGVDGEGKQYDGFFQNIRYNHIALLGAGQGRAGASIRIINQLKDHTMDFTRVKLANGRTVRVANEDVEAVEANDKEQTDKVKNMADPAALQEAMDKLAEVNKQLEELNKQKADLEGKLQAFKDQLEAVMAPAAVEEAAAAMNAEKEDANKVAAANSVTLTPEQLKLRGNDLRAAVVNAVRAKNSKPVLTAEQAKDASYIKGLFNGYVELAGGTTPPAGHQVVNAANPAATATGGAQTVQAVNSLPNDQKFAAMYGSKKAA